MICMATCTPGADRSCELCSYVGPLHWGEFYLGLIKIVMNMGSRLDHDYYAIPVSGIEAE